MLKTLAALAAITHLGSNALPQQAPSDRIARLPLIQLEASVQSGRVCAIPLLNPSAPAPKPIDPIAHTPLPRTFDKMAHPADIPACNWQH